MSTIMSRTFSSSQLEELCAQLLSRVRLFATPRTVAHQAPPSMGLSRQEHWSGLPGPPAADLADSGLKFTSLALKVDSLLASHSPLLCI